MHSLPVTVPAADLARADVVAGRLARKVAPLFGVTWEGNPYGRTWICDLAALTLAEVARGAPFPSRTEHPADAATPTNVSDGAAWHWVGRGVWTPRGTVPPATIPPTTLNRFGPDTKAAVVLTAANRLLVEATEAVGTVSRYLADRDVHPVLRLAVWAATVLEVYRAQPALVVAAVQARDVQRALTARWDSLVASQDEALTDGARSEVSPSTGDARVADALRPTSLDLIDATLPLLRLECSSVAVPASVVGDRLDDVGCAWSRRLLRVGRPGRGVVWLAERDGHRTAHAYLRAGAIVAPFVAEVLDDVLPIDAQPLPELPSAAEFERLPRPGRRALVVAAHAAVNYLRYRDDLLQEYPALRDDTRAWLDRWRLLVDTGLGPTDPASILLLGYATYLDLWDRGRSDRPHPDDLTQSVERVVAVQQDIIKALDRGRIDPGAATYLLEITSVALADAGEATDASRARERALARSWRACLAARGLSEASVKADPDRIHPAQAFHLLHYATHLARTPSLPRLRRALALLDRVTRVRDDVAQAEPVGYPAKHVAARTAHEQAAAVATRLAEMLPARAAAELIAVRTRAVRHALAALESPSTAPLLATGRPAAAVRSLAAAVLPALTAVTEATEATGAGAGGDRDPGPVTDTHRALTRALTRALEALDGPPQDLPTSAAPAGART